MNSTKRIRPTKKGVFIQSVTAVLICMASSLAAFGVVWPSYTLPLLKSDQSPIGYTISEYHSSLIGSFMMLGALFSPPLTTYAAEHFGRKKTMMLCVLTFVVGWSILATAKSVTQILIGRLATGIGYGMQFIVTVVFISEICHSSVLGALCSVPTLLFNIGILTSYVMGWLCSYQVINYSIVTTAVVLVVLMCWIKESPSYLLRKGMEKEALSSLKFYRGQSTATAEILEELQYLRSFQMDVGKNAQSVVPSINIEENEKLNPEKVNTDDNVIPEQNVWKLLRSSKSSQGALVNLAILMICVVFMGLMGVATYASQLFTRAAPGLSSDLCSVILAVVSTISSGISVVIVDLVPRRIFMISTCLLSALCMAVLAAQLRWSFAPEWLGPLAVVVYASFYCLGATNVPFVQLGECFPPEIKSFATSVILFCIVGSNFVLLILFPYSVGLIGLDGTYFGFAVICLGTAIISYFIMRETRRVPLHTIQAMFEEGFLSMKHTINAQHNENK